MAVNTSAVAAMAASANNIGWSARTAWLAALPARAKDGSYPFLGHRTVADLWATAR